MKQIELFYLTRCPYCSKARQAIQELQADNPAYGKLQIRWIEESQEEELANSRDYYNVPALFCDGQKLYEAKPAHSYDTIKENLRSAFDQILSA